MIYLDYAGSGIVRPEIAARYVDYCTRYSLNPHGGTRQAEVCRRAVLEAEQRLLACLGIAEGTASVVWTSGGTEALNLVIRGLQAKAPLAIYADAMAHPAMLESVKARVALTGENWRPVGPGVWDVMTAERTEGTVPLACVCHVNNETGEITDLRGIRQALGGAGVLVADAAQSFGKVPIDWGGARVDALTASSRKIGGPSAVGALVLRRGVAVSPLLVGGGQQRGLRSGTIDVIGAVMFADAAEAAFAEQARHMAQWQALSERLWDGLAAMGRPEWVRLSPPGAFPGIALFAFRGYEGAVIKRLLAERHDIVIGTGSACSAESGKTSHVLAAHGVDKATARGALRVSFGPQTTADEVDALLSALAQTLAEY